ncbi:MAG: hypothetical protein JXA21_09895, partial [Anaerolineae bacterium]|nr:hypothetical protein [Anaerolineae bacterium]
MPGNTVTIVEGGERRNIAASHLRLDDLVVVQAGDVIPADLKLVEVRGLEVDEFEITGEIMPVIKKVGTTDGFLYMGSRVLRGAATGMVVAVGERTEYGKVLREAFLCLFQLENPLQPDAHDVIGALTARGIRSIMLTGDRATTAVKGSAACGITAGSQACLTGRVLERMGAVEIAR